jgi:hypothetical protein
LSERYSVASVVLATFVLFTAPIALFAFHFKADAPFYFLAPDSFYYLGIALHSAHVPFFSNDTLHPTNGFHPLWEWVEYGLSKFSWFDLQGPSILPRVFALNIVLVGAATSLFAAYIYRQTGRIWLAVLATCPGLTWLAAAIGAPAFLNNWDYVNGMETGVELLFFSLTVLCLGRNFSSGWRFHAGVLCLGLTVLSRLDDVFFLLAIAAFACWKAPSEGRLRKLLPFAIPALMLAGYLLYNHHTVGILMPISGKAKAGLGYRSNIGEALRALRGSPFWEFPATLSSIFYAATYMRLVQMFLPMLASSVYLVCSCRRAQQNPVLQALSVGVILKGLYNFIFVGTGYQGDWYFGASIAVCNLLLAIGVNEILGRRAEVAQESGSVVANGRRAVMESVACLFGLTLLSFFSFNAVVSPRSNYTFREGETNLYHDRAALAQAIRSTGHPIFLEFQDGEISFATGLPSVSGFGLAADPEGAKAQKAGNFFDLLARRGVTIAASSGVYTSILEGSRTSKGVFPVWGYNREEIKHYRFDPFWSDAKTGVVLYHIVREPETSSQ